MNTDNYLILNTNNEEVNELVENQDYFIRISTTVFYFKIASIGSFTRLMMKNIEFDDWTSSTFIDTKEHFISVDKLLETVYCITYSDIDKSLNVYIKNDFMPEIYTGFYIKVVSKNCVEKLYILRQGSVDVKDRVIYIYNQPKKKEIKRYTNVKNIKSYNRTKNIIKLFYESDSFTKTSLAKKFKCSIVNIEKSLSKVNDPFIMKQLKFERKRTLDTNERAAINAYKKLMEDHNNKLESKDIYKYYEDKKCSEEVYNILNHIINRPSTRYIKQLLNHAKTTGWL